MVSCDDGWAIRNLDQKNTEIGDRRTVQGALSDQEIEAAQFIIGRLYDGCKRIPVDHVRAAHW
jgi:hypothetical protein